MSVSNGTVSRYIKKSGQVAENFHNEHVAFPPETKEIQFDEKWSFVGKKEKNCSEGEKDFGDQWDYIAIDAESRLIVSFVPGKRTHENCQKVVEDVYARTQGREDVLMSSDCFAPYKTVIEDVYGKR